MSLHLYADDVLCISGDSITDGNADASVKMPRGLRPLVKPFYTRAGDGLAGVPGAKMPYVTTYDVGMPKLICTGHAGDPIETLTGSFGVRVGNYAPRVLVVGLGANNLADVGGGTLATKVSALITKITTAANYLNQTLPVGGWLWWHPAWRNDETPGGTNQATLQSMSAIVGPLVTAAGGIFVDTQAAWLALPTSGPGKVILPGGQGFILGPSGTYTADGVHLNALGSVFIASLIMAQIVLHQEARG